MAGLSIARDRLAEFLPDPETIKKFEKLFQTVFVTDPATFDLIFQLIQEVTVGSGTAEGKAVQALDAIERIARALEVGASNPRFQMPNSFAIDYIDFNEVPPHADKPARMAWNVAEDTLNLHHSGGVTQQVGQELYGYFSNDIGVSVVNGDVIGFDPLAATFVKYIADGTYKSELVIGVATQNIAIGERGRATVWGRVRELDTTGAPYGEVWASGDVLYVSTTVAGGLTIVKPTAPNLSIPMGLVRIVDATNGEIAVRPVIEQQMFYGSFAKTADQVPSAANTANAVTWSSTTIASGVSIGAPTSRIVVANSGLYKFSASFQLTSGSASVKNVWFWFRKNGVDIANSSMITSMDSGTAIRTPSRSLFFSLVAGDYIEIFWASDDVNVTLDNIAATAFAPAAPAALLTVNMEQQ